MNLKHLKISTRLALCFTLILLLSFIATGFAQWRLYESADKTRQMMQQPLAKERMIADWYRFIQVGVRRTTAIAKSSDPSLTEFFAEDAKQTSQGASDMQKDIEPLISGTDEKQIFSDIAEQRKIYTEAKEQIVAAKSAGNQVHADQLIAEEFLPAAQKYQQLIQRLLDLQRGRLNDLSDQIEKHYVSTKYVLLALSAAAFAGGMLFTWLLARSIISELGGEPSYAAGIARHIAAGNLATEIELNEADQDSLLRAMKHMRDSLAGIVNEVRGGTETIASAADQIAAGNMDLSSRTEAQASALEETAASMEELNSTVRQNADHARQANQLAASASQIAEQGGELVGQVVSTMHGINHSAQKITEIIGVIDGIAFQTNILALNAAVEAARAGEQGRGFAVVASEVRNLAQRSASAAKEIKQLIDASVEQVGIGSRLVERAGSTMHDIVESVQQVAGIMNNITHASDEQSLGIAQVNQAIAQMDDSTQQNSALVEEAATASVSLQGQAQTLAQLVSVFQLGGKSFTEPSTVYRRDTTSTSHTNRLIAN